MRPPMLQTAYKVTTTRNEYGDFLPSGETAISCRFRYINERVTNGNNETVQSDAMAWFPPTADVSEGDIIKVDGEHYRIERLTKARRLRSATIHFLKADLLKYGVIS